MPGSKWHVGAWRLHALMFATGDECRDGHRRALADGVLRPVGFDLFDNDVYALCGDS